MGFKTVNVGDASYEVLSAVKKDAEGRLKINVSLSNAVQLSASAYFDLKKLREKVKKAEAEHGISIV